MKRSLIGLGVISCATLINTRISNSMIKIPILTTTKTEISIPVITNPNNKSIDFNLKTSGMINNLKIIQTLCKCEKHKKHKKQIKYKNK